MELKLLHDLSDGYSRLATLHNSLPVNISTDTPAPVMPLQYLISDVTQV